MPVLSGYECRSCGEAWDLVWARYAVGPTGWSGQTLECGWCALQLIAPVELDRSAWQHWSREHRSAVDRYPFLRRVSERIDASLAAAGLEGRGGAIERALSISLRFPARSASESCRRTFRIDRGVRVAGGSASVGRRRKSGRCRPILRGRRFSERPPGAGGQNPAILPLSRLAPRRRGSIAYSRKSEMMLRFVGCWLIGTLSLRSPVPV